ncbi:hypothetical protein JX265_008869 [Neoarthrinium moseri]|uniref:Ubiquitin carboxyl-terminal hydrolase n=1 Tax=Neoarthrinium moseri TaxID=1658444 RepID=A0A9P9WHE7_9PEZI|nr:uncharacterized protein JN550_009585 [Neoarthrinium moseri]KAI1848351.1 hypothetical protein JX266_005657 [Neoarthrinium moseri]KAI1863474.1 hypothetical protein JN550_009585 [Neoarthrinium moseri]KAI1863652.1 hypothetical protein JX265_008869 [Neoarthrinium moseri]
MTAADEKTSNGALKKDESAIEEKVIQGHVREPSVANGYCNVTNGSQPNGETLNGTKHDSVEENGAESSTHEAMVNGEDLAMKDMGTRDSDSSVLSDLPDISDIPDIPPEPVPPRRSGRSRKAPANYEAEYVIPAPQPASTPAAASTRPKRKAAATAQESFTSKADLDLVTDTICKPMTSDELKSYKGWVELESEPLFFQAMLHDMGAPDLKISELIDTDEAFLSVLSKPVHGLIFLFPYADVEEEIEVERHDCPEGLWFANQTTSNACATVALMNIVMNIPDHSFGSELKKFKDETGPLSTQDRGHALDANDFIRCIHNSVARRTQLLNEDLAWSHKREEEEKQTKKRQRAIKTPKSRGKGKAKAASASKRKRSATKAKDKVENANHYIAYVPHDGKVWEFDGLEDKPCCLGPSPGDADNWIATAVEAIQTRMAAGGLYTYNLLALCASPLQSLTDRLAANLAAGMKLEQQYKRGDSKEGGSDDQQPRPPSATSWPHPALATLLPPDKLASLNGLTWNTISSTAPAPDLVARMAVPGFGAEQAAALMAELLARQLDLETELASEAAGRRQARQAYEARHRDFTPFVHQFLLRLAERAALGEIVSNFL